MLSWETTFRLVRDRNPSPILVGLVLKEIEDSLDKMRGTVSADDVAYRGLLLKRFWLYQKLSRILNGEKDTEGRRVD